MSGFYWLSQLANGVIYFSINSRFYFYQRQEMDGWMDKSSQLDPRGTGTKNTKWWLDDMTKCASLSQRFVLFLRVS